MPACLKAGFFQASSMMSKNPEQKNSNLKVALILGAVALMISMWPLYVLNKWAGG
jgi:hypothetical protein